MLVALNVAFAKPSILFVVLSIVTVPTVTLSNVGVLLNVKVTFLLASVVAVKFASVDVTLWIALSAFAMLALVAADKSTA